MVALRARGIIDVKLAALGRELRWAQFAAGPEVLEAMAAGAVDFAMTGNTPPIFAAANGTDLRYIGYEPAAPHSEGVLVPAASSITDMRQLAGRTIAVARGSNAHYLLLSLLRRAGVDGRAVELAFLAPADASAAFTQGSVAAWAVWDPLLSAAIVDGRARLLADATGVSANHFFYLATAKLAQDRAVIPAILRELAATGDWINRHPQPAAALLAAQTGLNVAAWQVALGHSHFGALPITTAPLIEQQRIADDFRSIGLLPRAVHVAQPMVAPALSNNEA